MLLVISKSLEICLYIQYYGAMFASLAPSVSALIQGNQLWHARELLGLRDASVQNLSTGFSALDAVLPGRGWPAGQIVELICAQSTSAEWSLMLPALVTRLALAGNAKPSQLVLINPPHEPYLPSLQMRGVASGRVIRIDTQDNKQAQQRACWAAEQALHCDQVAAVVAWLPRAPAESLRRLQLAASQSQIILFVLRPLSAREHSSPAALRLVLHRLDALLCDLHILKCRGGAAQAQVQIEILGSSLRALLQARQQRVPSVQPIKTISQPHPIFRMTPRSQVIGLLPNHLLFGNERAAEGPAMNARAQHGLDRTTTFTRLLNPHTPTPTSTTLPAASPPVASIVLDRSVKREVRHARNR